MSPLQISKPVILGVGAAANCRSESEKDRQGAFRSGGDGGEESDDPLPGDLLRWGCKGGRQEKGDGEIDLESSPLLEPLRVSVSLARYMP